jgi:hypothetical protein
MNFKTEPSCISNVQGFFWLFMKENERKEHHNITEITYASPQNVTFVPKSNDVPLEK